MIQSALLLLGRICMSSLYLWAGSAKILNLPGTMEYMTSKNMPFIPFFLFSAIFFQMIGGLLLLLGYKTRLGALMLILFTLPAALIFHNYWTLQGSERLAEQIYFMNNIALIGGLLAYAVFGPGKYAIDKE